MLNSGAILGFPGEINKASSTLVNSYVKLEAAPEVLTGKSLTNVMHRTTFFVFRRYWTQVTY